jgi:serine/threonine protein kinase
MQQAQLALSEGQALWHVHNEGPEPYVVRYVAFAFSEGYACLLLEDCPGGSLGGAVNCLDEDAIVYLAATLLFTLFSLAGKYVLHSDVKPDNIALTRRGVSDPRLHTMRMHNPTITTPGHRRQHADNTSLTLPSPAVHVPGAQDN